MCGIVGAIYSEKVHEPWLPNEAAEILFPAVEWRGKDAFGWMHYEGGKSIAVHKGNDMAATEGLHLLDIPANVKWWVGHVRAATHGTPTLALNNHPIVHGEWLGVHNGVLWNYDSILLETGREDESAEVDSEAIFAAVDKWGLKPGLKEVDGSMAAVLVDRKNPDTVYLVRGEDSPLWLGQSTGGAWYFASTKAVLDELLVRWKVQPWAMNECHIATFVNGGLAKYEKYAEPTGLSWYGTSYNKPTPTQHHRTDSFGRPRSAAWGDLDDYDDWAFYDKWEAAKRRSSKATGKVLFYLDGKLLSESEYKDALEWEALLRRDEQRAELLDVNGAYL